MDKTKITTAPKKAKTPQIKRHKLNGYDYLDAENLPFGVSIVDLMT